MNVVIMKTKAEQSLFESFETIAPRLPGNALTAAARREAIELFASRGLPHRRLEEWRYTDLRASMKDIAPAAVGDAVKITIADVIVAMGPLASLDAYRVTFVNGAFRPELSNTKGAEGLTVASLAAALGSATAPDLDTAQVGGPRDDALLALNTAYMSDGAIVDIAAATKLAKPLLLVFVRAGAEARMISTRNIVTIGDGAEATVVEMFATLPGAAGTGQSNTVTKTAVGERAKLTHVKCAVETGAITHLSNSVVVLGGEASYRGFQLTAGPALARNQIFASYRGAGASLDLSGAFLGRGNNHIDTTLVVDHAVPGCQSRELYKGVLDGEAKGVFQGKIIVRPAAQKTDGKQMAQVLMLSPDAEFDSKPELEIYADDVACGHGSTSAEIDADHLFYCKARGIPEAEARALLTEAFVGEAIEKVEHEGVREALMTLARSWLKTERHFEKARRAV